MEDVSTRSRSAAMNYANTLHAGWLEEHLENVTALPKVAAITKPALSPAKLRLLQLRVQKARTNPDAGWFLLDERTSNARLRLFCFPHAGGSSIVPWRKALAPEIEVCPMRQPEPHFTEMRALIETLTRAITLHLEKPFAFYGHSMGAGVAFELTRSLRRNGLSLPVRLIVSSARAPQLRTQRPRMEDPTDDDLLHEVGRLGETPAHLLKLTLPHLRADTHLYRHYLYEPEAPLEIPIDAHLGVDDPSLNPEHMEAWKEQTTAEFHMTLHPGGHFFSALTKSSGRNRFAAHF